MPTNDNSPIWWTSPFYHQLSMSDLAEFKENLVPKTPQVPNEQSGTPAQTSSYSSEVDRVRFMVIDTQAALSRGDIPTVKGLLEQIEDILHSIV